MFWTIFWSLIAVFVVLPLLLKASIRKEFWIFMGISFFFVGMAVAGSIGSVGLFIASVIPGAIALEALQ
jgi:hypothetical protein